MIRTTAGLIENTNTDNQKLLANDLYFHFLYS